MFATGSVLSNGDFAFVSDGNIIVHTDARGASLQVIDMMGRILFSKEMSTGREEPKDRH